MKWLIPPVVLLLLALMSPLGAQTTYPIGQYTAGSAGGSAYALVRGYQFEIVSTPVNVVELGCYTPASDTNANEVRLFEYISGTGWQQIASATTTAGTGWRWETLSTPVSLQTGITYRVTVYTQLGWGIYEAGSTTPQPPGTTIDYQGVCWENNATGPSPGYGGPTYPNLFNDVAGYADIGYTTTPPSPGMDISPTPGTQQQVFSNAQGPGGNGVEAGIFDLSTNANGSVTLTSIDLTASGTGDDSAAFSEVQIYQDATGGTPGSYDSSDTAVSSTTGNFTSDDGTIVFNVVTGLQNFAASETRTFFVVVKLASAALPGDDFSFTVSDIDVGSANKTVSTTAMAGLSIDTPQFNFTDTSAATAATAFLSSMGNVCQEFTIAYPDGPDDKPTMIEIEGLGTADESSDLADVELWYDSDASGDFDSTLDSQVDSQSYATDDGTVTFDTSGLADFVAGDIRRYFVVYDLNANANDGETFQCYVSDATGMTLGGVANGLPIPGTSGTPGLVVSDNALTATFNGPTAAVDVDNDSLGVTGDGELLYDVTLAAGAGGAWTISSLTFMAGGTGNADTAFSEVALYEDDGNGTWDGSSTDSLAAPTATGFSGGVVTFNLTTTAFAAGSSSRFFLTVKLNASATAGETFDANLESVAATPPAGGVTSGIPAASSTALVIDVASLTVSAGPAQPSAVTHNAGTSADYLVAGIRMGAVNDLIDVSGVTLTTGGTGDWTSDVDSTTGVQVYLDDGDGTFDAASDTLLYQGAGGATVNAAFTSTVSVQPQSTEDLWVRVGLTSLAGDGQVAAPETFSLSIAQASHVNASANVVVGSPAPNSVTLSAIEFSVTSFTPLSDLKAGGAAVTINGSGFVMPLSVRIGGVACTGTPVISGGTQITGIAIPPGSGKNLPIEVTSGNLPPQTLTQTFDYSDTSSVGGSGNGSGDDGGGCVASTNTSWLAVLLLSLCFAAVAARRRGHARR